MRRRSLGVLGKDCAQGTGDGRSAALRGVPLPSRASFALRRVASTRSNLIMNGEARARASQRRAEAGHAEGLRNPGALARDRAFVFQEGHQTQEGLTAPSARVASLVRPLVTL